MTIQRRNIVTFMTILRRNSGFDGQDHLIACYVVHNSAAWLIKLQLG